jgi:tetratricopeptide (TPR) repeat protein
MPGGGARPGGGGGGRTPSFSPGGGGGRPGGGAQRPSTPGLTPGSRPSIGTRPSVPGGGGPGGNRPQIGNLPSTRPDVGGRPGAGARPGVGAGVGAGIGAGVGAGIGAGAANRIGNRPGGLPGLGDGRPGASQLPARTPQQRRDSLQNRLTGDRPSQLPARDWNQTRENWQQNRDQIREDWQNHRDQARDDWQNYFDDHYGRYGGWYWGHASGYWNRWDYMWDNHPVAAAVGLTWWGVNAVGSVFGTGDYSNPYYEEGSAVSYADPIVAASAEAPPAEGALPPGVSPEAVAAFDQAREAFMAGDYAKALTLTDQAVAKMPRDAVLHEFRSLVLFALKRYPESAAAINAVLAAGPGWDYQTLATLYPDIDTYTTQLRALEAAVKKSPKSANLRFLLGYHYLTLGYTDDALSQFKRAADLQPKDSVAASLVATLSPREPGKSKDAGPAPKVVPSDQIVGNWSAAGPRTAKYAMNLRKDGTFSWAYTRGSRKQEVKGVYTVEGNVLAMEPDGGGVMLAELTAKDDTLQFKMVGSSADAAPLDFRRTPSN